VTDAIYGGCISLRFTKRSIVGTKKNAGPTRIVFLQKLTETLFGLLITRE